MFSYSLPRRALFFVCVFAQAVSLVFARPQSETKPALPAQELVIGERI
jgi:hypothetical protein